VERIAKGIAKTATKVAEAAEVTSALIEDEEDDSAFDEAFERVVSILHRMKPDDRVDAIDLLLEKFCDSCGGEELGDHECASRTEDEDEDSEDDGEDDFEDLDGSDDSDDGEV